MAWDILSKYSFKNTSFKARLSFIIGLIFSIFLILIFILQYLFFRATLESDAMELLYGQFTSTTKFLEKVSLDYPFDSDKVSAIGLNNISDPRILFSVYNSKGEEVFSSSKLKIPINSHGPFRLEILDKESFLIYGNSIANGYLFLALNQEQYITSKVNSLAKILVYSGVFGIITIIIFSYLFFIRAFSSIDRLKLYISGEISEKDGKFIADEIGFLAIEFTKYKQRAENALIREKEFSSDASHELRTPLTVIKTSVELLQQKELNENIRAKIGLISDAAEGMEKIVNSLLLIDRGISKEGGGAINIGDFLKDFIVSFSDFAQKKGLHIHLNIQEKVIVNTNPERLTHIFGNLIRNAILYTESGEVLIEVTKNSVQVEDTGVGIPERDISHIWDRFYRGGITKEKKGSGLGLAIVKRLVDEASWNISVNSREGHGTVFTVRFK